ncbi:hypothetical protein SCLCIDRAFT_1217263 [Scleroderma citrinum Foug A]|uniref:Uncharacterized protein n=1 Tax=Scleroderma citrinum Foug A TaxID=1036808 RepID=A0A0C3DV15_9AGAM|nr:hypothetical protein SCLCIDRAFT_1217263 [Scleroderma citrinum Foug A]
MTSGGSVNSVQVEAAQLAVSSGPPTYCAECPNGLIKRHCRRDHIKTEPTKINSAQNGKTAHLGCTHAAQPCRNPPKHSYGVVEPKRRRHRIKFEPTNVNRALKIWNAYQGSSTSPDNPYHLIRAIARGPRASEVFCTAFRA